MQLQLRTVYDVLRVLPKDVSDVIMGYYYQLMLIELMRNCLDWEIRGVRSVPYYIWYIVEDDDYYDSYAYSENHNRLTTLHQNNMLVTYLSYHEHLSLRAGKRIPFTVDRPGIKPKYYYLSDLCQIL